METEKMPGHLILIVAVPGAGKSVLLAHIKKMRPELSFAVSCTTRPERPGEVNGETYYFISEAEFKRRIKAGEFLEWVQQDGGRYYGTLNSEIVGRIKAGEIVLREVEVIGAIAFKKLLPPENVSVIYITAGTWDEMEMRMIARAPISKKELEFRKERYEREIQFADEADYVIANTNGNLDVAKAEIIGIVDTIIDKVNQ